MFKAKLIILLLGFMAIFSATLAIKATRINDRVFYLTNNESGQLLCITLSFLTTTSTTVGTIPPPAGAIGWFTNSLCNGMTFRVKVSPN